MCVCLRVCVQRQGERPATAAGLGSGSCRAVASVAAPLGRVASRAVSSLWFCFQVIGVLWEGAAGGLWTSPAAPGQAGSVAAMLCPRVSPGPCPALGQPSRTPRGSAAVELGVASARLAGTWRADRSLLYFRQVVICRLLAWPRLVLAHACGTLSCGLSLRAVLPGPDVVPVGESLWGTSVRGALHPTLGVGR